MRAGIISVLIAFINLVEISSEPILDLSGSSLFILSIEMSSIFLNWHVHFCVPVGLEHLCFGGIFLFLARLGTMSVKYSQNLLAMMFESMSFFSSDSCNASFVLVHLFLLIILYFSKK